MSSTMKLRADVMRVLREPSERSLPTGYIDEAGIEVSDYLVTELNQTRVPWFLLDFILTVSPNQDEYLIDAMAPSFGKARFVYTIDPTDPNHHRRPVTIADGPEDLTAYYSGGDPAYRMLPSNWQHTARAIAFVFKVGFGNKAMVGPIPGQTAQYKVIYEPDSLRPDSPWADVNRLRQFDAYAAALTAQKCVTNCEWEVFDMIDDPAVREAANRGRRQELATAINNAMPLLADQFHRFKWTNKNPQDGRTIPFGSSRWRR